MSCLRACSTRNGESRGRKTAQPRYKPKPAGYYGCLRHQRYPRSGQTCGYVFSQGGCNRQTDPEGPKGRSCRYARPFRDRRAGMLYQSGHAIGAVFFARPQKIPCGYALGGGDRHPGRHRTGGLINCNEGSHRRWRERDRHAVRRFLLAATTGVFCPKAARGPALSVCPPGTTGPKTTAPGRDRGHSRFGD